MARHPHPAAIAATLAGIALFIALGTWQVRRAHEKEALFAAFDGAVHQPPMPLEQARREAGTRYPLVDVKGRFDPLRAYVLDNQVRDGRAGVMLARRGHKDARIEKILGGNFARVMREVWG